MNRPEHLTADELWRLLGYYATQVAEAEGILFTDNQYVALACDQWYQEMPNAYLEDGTVVK